LTNMLLLKPLHVHRTNLLSFPSLILEEKSKRSKLEIIYRRHRTTNTLNDFKSNPALFLNLLPTSNDPTTAILSLCAPNNPRNFGPP